VTALKAGWAEKFLAKLRVTGNVSVAAHAARVSRAAAYKRRNENKRFATDWDDAILEAGDFLEEEARRRAFTGVLEPVYGRVGKDEDGKIGTVRKYSDTLLIFLLKGAKPGKYRENHKHELSGPGGGAIPIREIIIERTAAAASEEDA